MNKSVLLAIVLAIGLFTAVGCSTVTKLLSVNATDTPASTEVQPTATPIPPTPTPAPTLTPTLAPPGNLPQDFLNALNNTKAGTAFRLDMTLNRTYINKLGKTVTDGGSIKIEENGADQHSTLSGSGLFSGANAGAATTFESISLGGTFYTKGITFTKGMDPNVWYQYPVIASSVITRSVSSGRSMLSNLNANNYKAVSLQATGVGIFDLLPCVVWTVQNPDDVKGFGALGNSDVERELKAVDSHNIQIWTCADGRMHQIKATIQAHDPAKPTDKITEGFTLHLYDFNAVIVISAPPNPQPVPLR